MTPVQVLHTARELIEKNNIPGAYQLLTQTPDLGNTALEIERWYLIAQISQKQGDLKTAIKIYRKILDDQPTLAKIRFELARCYMEMGEWYRADYHLRLAMTDNRLPDDIKSLMNSLRYLVRKNKNWNVWFNIGAAPDNNINAAAGGTECVDTIFGPMCRDGARPETAIGINIATGADYEFKLGDHWRWKNAATLYSNTYNKAKYNDLYIQLQSGPRYVYNRGSVWFAGIGQRRYFGHAPYTYGTGAGIFADYDITRRTSAAITLTYTHNKYDKFGPWMNGNTYSAGTVLSYWFDASKYIILRGGFIRENTTDKSYSYRQPGIGIGAGAELVWGFSIYIEPYFYWTNYDDGLWYVKDGMFQNITQRDYTRQYSIRVMNNKLTWHGFSPALTYNFTRRTSNVWQREFSKHTIGFTIQQRF